MKLSTKGRYGTRLMLDLAMHFGKGPILLKDIAARQEISEKYLGHLIPPLKAAGLINSSRGAHGGYTLARPPQTITLGNIVRAVEGNLNVVECVSSTKICPRVEFCVTREVWSQLTTKIKEVLDSKNLQEMVEQQKEKQKLQPWIYSI